MKNKNKTVWSIRFKKTTSKIFDGALLNLAPQTALFFFFIC